MSSSHSSLNDLPNEVLDVIADIVDTYNLGSYQKSSSPHLWKFCTIRKRYAKIGLDLFQRRWHTEMTVPRSQDLKRDGLTLSNSTLRSTITSLSHQISVRGCRSMYYQLWEDLAKLADYSGENRRIDWLPGSWVKRAYDRDVASIDPAIECMLLYNFSKPRKVADKCYFIIYPTR